MKEGSAISDDGFFRDEYMLAHERLIGYVQLRASIQAWLNDPRSSTTTKLERITELLDQFDAAEQAAGR
jgi:hypothetical protein